MDEKLYELCQRNWFCNCQISEKSNPKLENARITLRSLPTSIFAIVNFLILFTNSNYFCWVFYALEMFLTSRKHGQYTFLEMDSSSLGQSKVTKWNQCALVAAHTCNAPMLSSETGTGLVPVSRFFSSSLTLSSSDWSFCCHVTSLSRANCCWRSWSCLELWQQWTRLTSVNAIMWLSWCFESRIFLTNIDSGRPKNVAPGPGCSEPDQANTGKGKILIWVL